MGILVKHVLKHPKTGRLSFRRASPPELHAFLAGKRELKVSLQASEFTASGAMARYDAALAEWASTVAKARKVASGSFDHLDAPTIAYLGKIFEHELMDRLATARLTWGDDGADRARHGWEFKLPDFKEWRGNCDRYEMEQEWGSSARALLASRGLVVDPNDDLSFGNLCDELNTAAIRASGPSLALLSGEIVEASVPPPPPPHNERPRAASAPLSLLGTFDAYATARLKPLTAREWRPCIVDLGAFVGHDDAAKLTTEDLLRWRDKLLAETTKKGGLRQPVTVRGSYIGSVKSMLNWAVSERKLTTNVAIPVTVWTPKRAKLRTRDFTMEEATRILSATFAPMSPRVANSYVLARRWIPWLCAYTGARVNELSQLRGQDVAPLEGIWTIRITPEAGTVKTQVARIVPLHSHLIDQGFLGVVEAMGDGPLFYDPSRQRVHADTNRHVRKVGERLAEWVRKEVGIVDPNISPNHAWRHRFKTECRRIKMDPEVRDAIQGHSPRTEGEDYGGMPIQNMADEIERLPRYILPSSGS